MNNKVLLGKKIGMTQIFSEDGRVYPATVIHVGKNVVSNVIKNKEGEITHFELGIGYKKKTNKAEAGVYKQLGKVPYKTQVFKLGNGEENQDLNIGTELAVETFAVGAYVDIQGKTKGKGFQGVVKRWGFSGAPKSHGGPSGKGRKPGSIGAGATPSRVDKGKKMPGRMGNVKKTVQNLKILDLDAQLETITVNGAVPGYNGNYLVIKAAVKKPAKVSL